VIPGHLVSFREWEEMEQLQEDYNGEFTDGGMSEIQYSRYEGVPSISECDQLCAELSYECMRSVFGIEPQQPDYFRRALK